MLSAKAACFAASSRRMLFCLIHVIQMGNNLWFVISMLMHISVYIHICSDFQFVFYSQQLQLFVMFLLGYVIIWWFSAGVLFGVGTALFRYHLMTGLYDVEWQWASCADHYRQVVKINTVCVCVLVLSQLSSFALFKAGVKLIPYSVNLFPGVYKQYSASKCQITFFFSRQWQTPNILCRIQNVKECRNIQIQSIAIIEMK